MRLFKYLQEDGETTANIGATTTPDVAKYEPKLSFITRRKKKKKDKKDEENG